MKSDPCPECLAGLCKHCYMLTGEWDYPGACGCECQEVAHVAAICGILFPIKEEPMDPTLKAMKARVQAMNRPLPFSSTNDGDPVLVRSDDYEIGVIAGGKAIYVSLKDAPTLIKALSEVLKVAETKP